MGLLREQCAEWREGTSAVLLQSGLDENWWADSMEWYTYLRNIQDFVAEGKTPYERRCGEPFEGPIIPFGAMVEYHPISTRDQSNFQQLGKTVFPGIFRAYALIAGEFGKETLWLRISRNWKRCTYQQFVLGESMRKKYWLISQKGEEFIFRVADGTAKMSGRDYEFREPTQRRKRTVRSEDLSGELQGEPEGPQPTELKRWRWSQGGLLVDPRWLHLSSSHWTSSSMFSCERQTKIQVTTGPEDLQPEVWAQFGKAAQRKEKQEWAFEKRKLDTARRLSGIYFIDPEDGAYKETKTARKSWKFQWRRQCFAKRTRKHSSFQETEAKSCMHRGGSWVHETTFGMISAERSRRLHRRQRI